MTRTLKRYILRILIPLAAGILCSLTGVWALELDHEPYTGPDETLLMFVGEETKVLGIASRREQSAWQAPAVARVLTRNDLRKQGADTLRDALKNVPGFYMAQKEWGTQPYLRGIPNSTLFLYDTVPIGSEVTKSIHHLDYDLALWSVKRIEIINGPASVLWGPDAFAGLVNVVPMTGKDLDGVETGAFYQNNTGDHYGCFINAGHDGGLWDAFLGVSGRRAEEDDRKFRIVRFWGDDLSPVPPEDRLGEGYPGKSKYFDAYAHVSYDDWLNLSGRMSYNEKPYTMSSDQGNTSWGESRKSPFGFIKLEAKKDLDRFSAIKFMSFYSQLRYDHDVIDESTSQKETTTYGELIYDRSFMSGTAIFTGGATFRKKRVSDAPIWRGYLPDFLEFNEDFFPQVLEESYDGTLWSVFGQVTKTVGKVDFFAGARHDMHDDFDDQTSLSAGFGWSPAASWRCKLLGGTAYRTPFSQQLYEEENPDLEEVKSLNLQVSWDRRSQIGFSATGFYQWLDNHVMEDPYAGLSFPNEQEIYGIEMEGYLLPHETLRLDANLTLLENTGPREKYRYVNYELDEEGKPIPVEVINIYPYDVGADVLFNATATWQPIRKVSLYLHTGYAASRSLLFPRGDEPEQVSVPSNWLFDATALIRDALFPGADLELSVKNLFDNQYETPGTYDVVEGEPFTARIVVRIRW